MNEDFQKLKDIGAQKIHEATHISKQHVQSILNESFENMSKVQFLGFISILEREFDVRLDGLKERGKEYFGEVMPEQEEEEAKVFVTPAQKKNYTKLYIVIAAVIFLFVAIFTLSNISSSSNDAIIESLDNNSMEMGKQALSIDTNESNLSLANSSDENLSEVSEEEAEKKAVVKSFNVIPKVKLWMGYIDLSDYKRYQKLTSKEFSLDPDKEWLLSLGHGYVSFEIDGKLYEYNEKKNVKFLYKDGEIEKISTQEFKRLNRGNTW